VEETEYLRIAALEQHHWWYVATRRLIGDLLEPWLSRSRSLRILDAGCGTGATGGWLSKHGRVVGADISSQALRLLRERYRAVEGVEADLAALPFDDATFDVVVAITVLYHVDDDRSAVRELARVLRPGGVTLHIEPSMPSLRRAHDAVVDGRRRYRIGELTALLEDAGLTVRRATYVHSYLVPFAAALAFAERIRPQPVPRSDIERPRLSRTFGALASLERRLLARRNLPFGLSVAVVAVRE
jgi:ubiquinone/menaquinone biosynthesis C-methylase UbiE